MKTSLKSFVSEIALTSIVQKQNDKSRFEQTNVILTLDM